MFIVSLSWRASLSQAVNPNRRRSLNLHRRWRPKMTEQFVCSQILGHLALQCLLVFQGGKDVLFHLDVRILWCHRSWIQGNRVSCQHWKDAEKTRRMQPYHFLERTFGCKFKFHNVLHCYRKSACNGATFQGAKPRPIQCTDSSSGHIDHNRSIKRDCLQFGMSSRSERSFIWRLRYSACHQIRTGLQTGLAMCMLFAVLVYTVNHQSAAQMLMRHQLRHFQKSLKMRQFEAVCFILSLTGSCFISHHATLSSHLYTDVLCVSSISYLYYNTHASHGLAGPWKPRRHCQNCERPGLCSKMAERTGKANPCARSHTELVADFWVAGQSQEELR